MMETKKGEPLLLLLLIIIMPTTNPISKIQTRRKMTNRRNVIGGYRRRSISWNGIMLLCITFLVVIGSMFKITSYYVGHANDGGANDKDIWIKSDAQNFNDNNVVKEADHLIMVAGHSVIVSGHLRDAGLDEKDWYLLDYQKGRGLPQAILSHIKEGIRLASTDSKSLLIFSGGETRSSTGPSTEGGSYFHVSDAMDLWEGNVRARTTAEEFATDSFQNL